MGLREEGKEYLRLKNEPFPTDVSTIFVFLVSLEAGKINIDDMETLDRCLMQ